MSTSPSPRNRHPDRHPNRHPDRHPNRHPSRHRTPPFPRNLGRVIWRLIPRYVLPSLLLMGPSLGLSACAQFTAQGNAETPAALSLESQSGSRSYRLTPLLQGLEHPWGMAWLPDGSLLITERAGRLKRVVQGKPEAIAGLPRIFAAGQGGLLDLAVHPQFAKNRLVYFTYAQGDVNANRTRVARARLEGTQLRNWQDLVSASPTKTGTQHFGARLLWLPDETLLVSIGDGGNPPLTINGELNRTYAQKRTSHLGKLLRLKDDGSVPTDNPWAKQGGVAAQIWSYGHRNIQGLAWDPVRNRVWATEHGARGGDELNGVMAGKNYGWPTVSLSRDYRTGEPVAASTTAPGLVDPLLVWTPAIAPSGLVVYSDRLAQNPFPQWRGDLLAGGLVSRDLKRLRLEANGRMRELEAIAIGERVRDVRQGPDGLIYVLTDHPQGQLLRLDPPR